MVFASATNIIPAGKEGTRCRKKDSRRGRHLFPPSSAVANNNREETRGGWLEQNVERTTTLLFPAGYCIVSALFQTGRIYLAAIIDRDGSNSPNNKKLVQLFITNKHGNDLPNYCPIHRSIPVYNTIHIIPSELPPSPNNASR